MSPTQKKRLHSIAFLVVGLSLACGLILFALSKNLNLFYTPSQLKTEKINAERAIRVGGMVVKNSVMRSPDLQVNFVITDFNQEVTVRYQGILPDLFREGQGVVVLGKLGHAGTFEASQVLAKHDEKYMPPEVAASLQAQLPQVGTT